MAGLVGGVQGLRGLGRLHGTSGDGTGAWLVCWGGGCVCWKKGGGRNPLPRPKIGLLAQNVPQNPCPAFFAFLGGLCENVDLGQNTASDGSRFSNPHTSKPTPL
jgi:hypothetical protein